MRIKINETDLEIGRGLLDFSHVDAFILPANNFLWFSENFERLKEIGGIQLESEATEKGPVEIGQAVITEGGRLNAKYIIHAAAWGQDLIPSSANIRRALLSALDLAVRHYCHSVAVPVAGAEMSGFPLASAIDITFMTMIEYCLKSVEINRIIFLANGHKEEQLLSNLLNSAASANPSKNK